MAEEHGPLAAPLCTVFPSALIENLRKAMGTLDGNDAEAEIESSKVHWSEPKSVYFSAVEVEIEASKVHWSERKNDSFSAEGVPSVESPPTSNSEDNAEEANDNMEVFQSLQKEYPSGFFVDERTVGPFGEVVHATESIFFRKRRFRKYGLSSETRFAEGGQAELFYAHKTTDEDNHKKKDESYVLKVFKDGTSLKDLVSNIPPVLLEKSLLSSECNIILGARLLKSNGRFAFLMKRAWGDLRKLIDMRKKLVNNNPALLFPEDVSVQLTFEIAKGMRDLHKVGIVHRDLKASNVLIYPEDKSCTNFDLTRSVEAGEFSSAVADYECSGGIVGTGFWRAPEILRAVKNRDHHQKPELFSKAADVYSFGITCYEILSGDIFLEKWGRKDFDRVIGGERPILPNYTRPWMRDLVNRCWHADPSERPTFEEIFGIFRRSASTHVRSIVFPSPFLNGKPQIGDSFTTLFI